MALSATQADAVVTLFVDGFLLETDVLKRKRMVQNFEDNFGRGITDWKERLLKALEEKTTDEKILEEYRMLSGRTVLKGEDFTYRAFCEQDFPAVRELLNRAFDMCITEYDNEQIKKLVNGYSMVACDKDDILGVALTYVIPGLHFDKLYVESLAVSEHARGQGIARRLLNEIQKKGYKNKVYTMQLITNRQLEAYQMYKHLGFGESKYVLLSR